MLRFKFLVILIFFHLSYIFPQMQLSDSAKISIMTAYPYSGAIYSMYGHTAISVQDKYIDAVFNYGFFDSSKKGFILNFIMGKTDYVLGAESYKDFIDSYADRGISIVEQELNVTREEKQKIWEKLYTNSLPNNREYRYNYFLDNCTTKPRDIIEKYVDNNLFSNNKSKENTTYRSLIHEYVDKFPWVKFGIDIVIASYADTIVTERDKMFLPIYFMNHLDSSIIKSTNSYPLVLKKQIIKPSEISKLNSSTIISPIVFSIFLLILSILLTLFDFKRKHGLISKIFDYTLFTTTGACGILIIFLWFFSVHPTVTNNWNIIWLNPLTFIASFFVWNMYHFCKKTIYIYHFINFVLLILFLLAWIYIPQKMPIESIFISLVLILRSLSIIISIKKYRSNTCECKTI